MSARDALRTGAARLAAAGVEGAADDARILLAHALDLPRERLLQHMGDALSDKQARRFEAAIAARAARQPVAQITGRRLFHSLPFRVSRETLDPRPETEVLVAEALREPAFRILDLGTGTGCILLSILKAMPMARGIGIDLSAAALDVARGNAGDLGLAPRARFLCSDWFSAVDGRFDLIVSNPPYIAEGEMATLAPEVRDWEPVSALVAGADGLDAIRAIMRGVRPRLMAGGRLLVEIGPAQGAAVAALMRAQGLDGIRILRDLDGRDRVVAARAPGGEGCGAI